MVKADKKPKERNIDWTQHKFDFFTSDYVKVKPFFDNVVGFYNAGVTRFTKGWSKEKEKWKADLMQKALEEVGNARKKELKKMLGKIIDRGIKPRLEPKRISKEEMKDIMLMWKMIRTEVGLPTTITKETRDDNVVIRDYSQESKDKASKYKD